MCVEYLNNLVYNQIGDYSIMIKFHDAVINMCVIKKFSLCDKTTLPIKLFEDIHNNIWWMSQ